MNEPTELLPCPFCGSERVERNCMTPDDVACLDCDALASSAAAWNRRAPQPSASAAEFAIRALVAAGHVSQELVDASLNLPGAPQPNQAQAGVVPLTSAQIERSAKKLAECMDYPWEYMSEKGRDEMRKHAKAVMAAGGIKHKEGGQDAD